MRIHLQAVPPAKIRDLLGDLCRIIGPVQPQHDVLHHTMNRHQCEMLVDHADPEIHCIMRGVDSDRLPVNKDLARVRLVHAVENAHERRLACTVLTKEGQHLALADFQIDSVICNGAGKALPDSLQFYCSLFNVVHGTDPSPWTEGEARDRASPPRLFLHCYSIGSGYSDMNSRNDPSAMAFWALATRSDARLTSLYR